MWYTNHNDLVIADGASEPASCELMVLAVTLEHEFGAPAVVTPIKSLSMPIEILTEGSHKFFAVIPVGV